MRKWMSLAIALLLAGMIQAQVTSTPTSLGEQELKKMNAFQLVQSSDIDTWARELLKDEYRGRRSGDVGYDKAASFVRDYFQEWGLKPMGDNGTYYSNFDQPYNDVLGYGHMKSFIRVGKDTVVKEYKAMVDFFPTALSANGEVTAEVVYVGYGIDAPELGYNDYKGVDVKGKIVLVEGGYPYTGTLMDSLKMWSKHQDVYAKIAVASKAGAKGVLFVSRFANPFPPKTDNMVVAFISAKTADDLMLGTGQKLADLKKKSNAFKFKAVPMGRWVSIKAETKFSPNTKTCNIVGVIEGTDPLLKNEYIILGAHLDHLGMLPEMHPGALDNVSGSVIMMSAAKALATSGVQMKRSVIVVLFAAEELGVLGGLHYIKSMPFAKDKITAMINVDMLGKGTGISVGTASRWADLLPYFRVGSEEWARRPFTQNVEEWSYKTRMHTDGNAFQNQEIPTYELRATGGPWPVPYHVPGDVITQLDPVIMADATRAMVIATIDIANK